MIKATIFLGLVLLSLSENWQASGNFTADNITFIFSTIDNTLQYIADGDLSSANRAKNISDTLNDAWHPAWNVFYFSPDYYSEDSIVYGYAFNGHWFWVNNYKKSQIGNFVIWKDYNCHTWMDTASAASPKMVAETLNLLKDWFKSTLALT